MLTLKYVTLDDGKEIISECHSITVERLDNGMRRVISHSAIPGMPDDEMGFYFGDGPVKHGGRTLPRHSTLFVMNRFGATVGVYHFEKSNVPLVTEMRPPEQIAA